MDNASIKITSLIDRLVVHDLLVDMARTLAGPAHGNCISDEYSISEVL